jgi:outer membrane protein with beta-barrel domain
MRKPIIVAALATLGLTGTAFADDEVSYNFVEGGYVHSEFDDLDVDGNGLGVRGEVAFTKNVHGFASYSRTDFDFDITADQFEIGAGVNWSLAPKLDLVGQLGYVGINLDAPGVDGFDDSGIELRAQLRSRLSEMLELRGGLSYANLDETGDGTAGEIGARFYITKMFALGADATFDSDGTTWMLGARFDFNHP